MARRIQTRAKVLAGASPDDYASRIVKYIPADVVALYIGLVGLVPADYENRQTTLWAVFAVGVIVTPIYLLRVTKDPVTKKPLIPQVFIGTLAFAIWAFALGGPFAELAFYEPFIGSMAVMVATFAFGLIQP